MSLQYCISADPYNYVIFTNEYFIGNIFRLPLYVVDNDSVVKEMCTKKFPTHHSLSPGMVMMSCQHRTCYGFQILRSKESAICILNLLLTHFSIQSHIIIYDNACNLHRTCMTFYIIEYFKGNMLIY